VALNPKKKNKSEEIPDIEGYVTEEMLYKGRRAEREIPVVPLVIVAVILVTLMIILAVSKPWKNGQDLSDGTLDSLKVEQRDKETEKKKNLTSADAPWFYVDHKSRIYFDETQFNGAKSLVIPSHFDGVQVKVVNGDSFKAENSTVESVVISEGIISIGDGAFSNFSKLENITLPATLDYVTGSAFRGTPWYKAQNEKFVIVGDGVLIKYNGSDENVRIPANVKAIDCSAFMGVKNAKKITIPQGVKYIGENVFTDCSAEEIEFPSSVNDIANTAFLDSAFIEKHKNKNLIVGSGCMISYEVKNNIIRVPQETVLLTNLNFPEDNDITLYIGEKVSKISDMEALGLVASFKAAANSPVFSTDNGVLYNRDKSILYRFPIYSDMKRYEVYTYTKQISSEAFMRSDLEYILLPQKLSTISDRAFEECEKLKKIQIPDTAVNIGTSILRNCKNLEICELPDTLIAIPHGIFLGCTSLESVHLSDNVRTIKGNAFYGCTSLKELYIPENLSKIEPKAFYGCDIKFTIDAKNDYFQIVDGKLTEKEVKKESIAKTESKAKVTSSKETSSKK